MLKDYSKYIIQSKCSVLEALMVLNTFGKDDALTLFVVEENGDMVGTITDGDIRRKLVEKLDLSKSISLIMHCDFHYLRDGAISVDDVHVFKNKGIVLVPVLDLNGKIVDIINLKYQKSYLPIDAVLMAGGKGERLRPLTEKTPKPLIPVGDKAIIDYNIERLISYGIKHVNVTVNYLKEKLEEHFREPKFGVKIECVREPQFLGTVGSARIVKEFYNDTILIMNSDLFTNIDYEDFYLHFKEYNADMSVAAVPYTVSIPYGIFELEGRDIKSIKEKPIYNYYANAGIYLIKRSILDYIPENTFFNATDLIEKLVQLQMKVVRFPISGYWIDIGLHADLQKANDIVKHL